MLAWTSPLRNALLLAGLGLSFVMATAASVLIGGANEASAPEPQATRSPVVSDESRELMAQKITRARLAGTPRALPTRVPTLEEILDSAVVLVEAQLIAPPLNEVAAAIVTPTETPAPMHQEMVAPPPPPAPPPAQPRSQSKPAPRPVAPAQAAQAPAPPPAPPASSAGAGVSEDAAYTRAVWDAVNALRTARGLAPLRADPALEGAARSYALVLARAHTLSHTGPDGSTMSQRLAAAGVVDAGGEVLALGTNGWPAQGIAQAWLDSPPHRDLILGPYSRAGVACAFTVENGATVVRCVMELAS